MGARRYGISRRVCNSIAHELDVELNTHINTIALYWEEKPTSLMNENKWIDNPRITIVKCVGADS